MNLLAVISVVDVANSGSVRPWEVWNSVLNLVVAVGKSNEHVSSSEGIKVVLNVFLVNLMVIRRSGVSSLVDGGGHLVNVRIGVHVLPE